MESQSAKIAELAKEPFNYTIFFKRYIIKPLKSGLYGFAMFFSVLILTKGIAVFIGTFQNFQIDLYDVLLSMVGFLLTALIAILENLKSD